MILGGDFQYLNLAGWNQVLKVCSQSSAKKLTKQFCPSSLICFSSRSYHPFHGNVDGNRVICPTMNPSLGYGFNMFQHILMLPSSNLGQMRFGYVWMGTSMDDCQVHYITTLLPKSWIVGSRCGQMFELGQLRLNRASCELHKYIHIYMYVCMYVGRYVCMYVCIYYYIQYYMY